MTSAQQLEAEGNGPTWADVFPVLRRLGRERPEWVGAPAIPGDGADLAIKTAVDLAVERFPALTLGDAFPSLTGDWADFQSLRLGTRALNALTRAGASDLKSLLELSVEDLLDVRNLGEGTIREVVHAVAREAVDLACDPSMACVRMSGTSPVFLLQPSKWELTMRIIAQDFRTVAEWHALRGDPHARVLTDEGLEGAPSRVTSAFVRLRALECMDVVELELVAPATILEGFFSRLDPRSLLVAKRRVFSDVPDTLDAIGQELGVTRERVRQISLKLSEIVTAAASEAEQGQIWELAAAIRGRIGIVSRVEHLLEVFPGLADPVESVGQPAWRVLDVLDDEFEVVEGWAAVPSVESVRSLTTAAARESADEYGLAPVETVGVALGFELPARSAELEEWLRFVGLPVFRGRILTVAASISGWVAVILSSEGAPLPLQEIIERMPVERAGSSVRNVLAVDPRFQRVDRDSWALASWAMDGYTGIRDLISQEIEKAGGAISVDILVERLTSKFDVSEASIRTYAAGPPFKTRDRLVALSGDEPRHHKTPARTRRLFRTARGWTFRFQVTPDHMRGSGFPVPVAVATVLGLDPGQSLQLTSSEGAQSAFWTGAQPGIGSIRRFMSPRGLDAGQEAFLRFFDGGSFDVEAVTWDPAASPLTKALVLVGAGAESAQLGAEASRLLLSTALGLDTASPWASIIGWARDRGDDDVAGWLLAADLSGDSPVSVEENHGLEVTVDDILGLL